MAMLIDDTIQSSDDDLEKDNDDELLTDDTQHIEIRHKAHSSKGS